MSNNSIYKCVDCNLSFLSGRQKSNHVRWHHSPRKEINYQLRCSCLICQKETSVQSLSKHITTHEPKKISGKCKNCECSLYDINLTFCGQSCSAKYNNIARKEAGWKISEESKDRISTSLQDFYSDYTKLPKPRNKHCQIKERITTEKLSFCQICNDIIFGWKKTCSSECKNKFCAMKIKQNIYMTGRNPNSNRGRGKQSYLERTFETWLLENNVSNFLMEHHFRRKDQMKSYFSDFYFPDLKLVIELDGAQHKLTQEYDKERDHYISSQYDVQIIRITEKEYRAKSRIDEIKQLLKIS